MSVVNEVLAANASYVTFHDEGPGPGSAEANYVDWLTIGEQAQSLLEDVQRIRNHPLVPGRIPIYNFIFDVATGALHEVTAARAAGAAA